MLPLEPSRALQLIKFLGTEKMAVIDYDGACALCDNSTITKEDVQRVHSEKFTGELFSSDRKLIEKNLLDCYELIDKKTGKPNRYEPLNAKIPLYKMMDTILIQLTASYLGCRLAVQQKGGFCFVATGGNHHSRYDNGAGFCLLNDIIIAARKMQAEGHSRLIWIIDVDAHKGCGSAELVSYIRNKKNPHGFEQGCGIKTLSVHMTHGWPLDDETLRDARPDAAPLISSDIEIPVETGRDNDYVPLLKNGLQKLEAISGGKNADLAIVVDGADPYEKDELASSGLLRLTLEQCLERDLLIYNFLQKREIASAWIMAGGYGENAWEPPAHFLKTIANSKSKNIS
ncbi:hypothetical protein FACS189494_02200 [Spirochaetia bacterium]|nr:hypothetical protein FACS189494_02200 [Spirochaetia bacterium]